MGKAKTVFGRTVVWGFLIVLLVVGGAFGDIRLPAVIGDNMVLQQGEAVAIWGWADPGEEVMVSASWHPMQWGVKADKNGKWRFNVTSPKAGGPYEITLKGKNTVTIKNILAGEVWVGSGQSNMQMSVQSSANSQEEIASAKYPQIRLFQVEREVSDTPKDDCTGSWVECSPETVPGFSAAAYFFGRELHTELDIPIGLIHTSWGGTPAEAWTPRDMLESDEDFKPILTRFDDAVAKYPQAKAEYDEKVKQWEEAVKKAKEEGTKAPGRPYPPFGPGHYHSPAGLYNAMIAPVIPYGIQGAIWYQGESNAGRAYQYRELFPAMIKSWRKNWGQGDFPFLFVQLANFMAVKDEPTESAWAELREAQLQTLSVPNTGMAVIVDIGDEKDIHPKNKQDVGKRLAAWALGTTYGRKTAYSGPLYKSMKVEGNRIVVTFDHVGGGLVAGGDGPLRGFAIAGEDKKFVWSDAKIEGGSVVVQSEQVAAPVAVRYAWADNPLCNLYNKEGLPASPFRTDDWLGLTVNAR